MLAENLQSFSRANCAQLFDRVKTPKRRCGNSTSALPFGLSCEYECLTIIEGAIGFMGTRVFSFLFIFTLVWVSIARADDFENSNCRLSSDVSGKKSAKDPRDKVDFKTCQILQAGAAFALTMITGKENGLYLYSSEAQFEDHGIFEFRAEGASNYSRCHYTILKGTKAPTRLKDFFSGEVTLTLEEFYELMKEVSKLVLVSCDGIS